MSFASIVESLAGNGLVRRSADLIFRRFAQTRVRRLDDVPIASCQEQQLLSLVRKAVNTRFGKDHDFRRIRSVADFQQRVPLRTYEDFWKDYWQPAFPTLANITWPEAVPYFALSSGTTSGTTKYIPVSSAMLASNRRAALTSLAWFRHQFPAKSLFTGRMFFLGGSTDLTPLVAGSRFPAAGDLSGIAAREVPTFLRAYTFPPLEVALLTDWERKMTELAERSAKLPITLVSGVPSWMLVLFERLQLVTGKKTLAEIWPTLQVVVHGGTKFDPYRSLFQRMIGSDAVQYLETYPASEGFIAAEDPRFQLLRLVPDHGIFFEFVPVDELGRERPTRHSIGRVVPGVQYAVVLTTCAGLWSYVIGDTVCFEKADPPLFRFTGRTKYYLSAFGEHLISEEVERAIASAAQATDAEVLDFHVGPIFPGADATVGHHRFLLEFARIPADLTAFARKLDEELGRINEDYRAHRVGDLTMRAPEVMPVRRGFFNDWLRAHGKLGGQHKVPRMDNTGRITLEMSEMMRPG